MSKSIICCHFFKKKSDVSIVAVSTQKILQHARLAEQGLMTADPIKESISLQLDMINIL
jgi:dephospho-CoA kinase